MNSRLFGLLVAGLAIVVATCSSNASGHSVEVTTKDQEEDNDNTCSICYDEFEDDKNIQIKLRCGHSFHKDCLKKWTKQSEFNTDACPVCRGPLVLEGEELFSEFLRKRKEFVRYDVVSRWLPDYQFKLDGHGSDSFTISKPPNKKLANVLKYIGLLSRSPRKPTCAEERRQEQLAP